MPATSAPPPSPPAKSPSAQRPRDRAAGWSVGIQDTAGDLGDLLGRIEEGLGAATERRLRERLGLSLAELAALLGTSARTLGRRHEEGRLSPEESERLYRYARLFERAVEVLGDEESARTWMKTGQLRLGGRAPLQVARFEPGAREVEDLLGRVERGLPA